VGRLAIAGPDIPGPAVGSQGLRILEIRGGLPTICSPEVASTSSVGYWRCACAGATSVSDLTRWRCCEALRRQIAAEREADEMTLLIPSASSSPHNA